jgi:hypothetical protein
MPGLVGNANEMRENHAMSRPIRVLSSALAVGATIAAAGCGGGGHGGASSGGASSSTTASSAAHASYLATVTRAAYATDQVPGYKFSLKVDTKLAGNSSTIEGGGTINDSGSEGTASLQVEGKTINEVIAKPYLYVSVPGGDTSVTHGKSWLRGDLNTFSQSYGSSSIGAGSSNPTEVLSYLKAAGTVTRSGEEQVRGVTSTHYRALIDLTHFADSAPAGKRAAALKAGKLFERITGAKTLPMDVWIGAGRITRVALAYSVCAPQGRLQETLSMDLYDYGRQPVVSPPPAAQVADLAATLKSEVAKSLAQLGCH